MEQGAARRRLGPSVCARRLLLAALGAAMVGGGAGCSDSLSSRSAGDASPREAGARVRDGSLADLRRSDRGLADRGLTDRGLADRGLADRSSAGASDGGVRDRGLVDAGLGTSDGAARVDGGGPSDSGSLTDGAPAPVVSTRRTSYQVGEAIEVDFSGLPGNATDWITIVPASAADDTYGEYFYSDGAVQGTFTFAGLTDAGEYEVRAYFNWYDGGGGGYTVWARSRFTVQQ